MNVLRTSATKSSDPLRKIKIGAACGLAIALLAIVLYQKNGVAESDGGAEGPTYAVDVGLPRSDALPADAQAPSGNATDARNTPQRRLPQVDMAKILDYNPFAAKETGGTGESREAVAGQSRSLQASQSYARNHTPTSNGSSETLREGAASGEESIAAIVRGREGAAVLIGDRLVREADILDERWRVVAIRQDAIVLEPINSAAGR